MYYIECEEKFDLNYRNLDSLNRCWVKYQGFFLNDCQSG